MMAKAFLSTGQRPKVLEWEKRPIKEINTDNGKISSVQALKELAHISSASCLSLVPDAFYEYLNIELLSVLHLS